MKQEARILLIIFVIISAFHLIIAFNLPSFIPAAHFPYDDLLRKYFAVYPLTPFANFDGYQYISIAKIGYSELQQSFFPFYPQLIAVASWLTFKQYILAGLLVSWVCLFFGLFYFLKLSEVLLKNKNKARWSLIFLVAFPTAFFFQAVYTESLFLLLSSGALYYLLRKKYFWASVLALLASFTKTQGVLLLVPFFIVLFGTTKFEGKKFSWKLLPVMLSPLYGLALYSSYLFARYKDPLYFYHTQSAFHLERSVNKFVSFPQVLYRYFKIFLTTPMNFTYWVSVLEFSVFVIVFAVVAYELVRLWRKKERDIQQIAIQLYSLIALIFPTITGTLVSVPRFALISLGFFIVLAKVKNVSVKVTLAIVFSCLQIILFVYFLKGYFIS